MKNAMRYKKQMMVIVAVSSIVGYSKEVKFVPTVANADGSYSVTNVLNWSGGQLPDSSDVWVFDPGTEAALTVTVEAKKSGYQQFAGMKFMSGSTTLASGTYLYANGNPTTLDVAEGATACCKIVFDTWNKKGVVKTGAGTFKATNSFGEGNSVGDIDVQQGLLQVEKQGAVKNTRLRIRDGATFYASIYNMTLGDVQIDKGGTLQCNGREGAITVGNLTGEGEIVDLSGSWTGFTIKPKTDCVFSGTMNERIHPTVSSAATGRFILGTATTVADCGTVTGSRWLGFLPGVDGAFILGLNYGADTGYPLHLADTNGAPVTVRVRLVPANSPKFSTSGPGDVQFDYYGVTLVGNRIQNTGSLRAGIQTTLGDGSAANDFDFSSLTGLTVVNTEIGHLVINNALPTVVKAKVTGIGDITVKGPTTFLDYCYPAMLKIAADVTLAGGSTSMTVFNFTGEDTTLTLAGGVQTLTGSLEYGTGVTKATMCLDGGQVRAYASSTGNLSPFGNASSPLAVTIGPKGGRIFATMNQSSSATEELAFGYGVSILKTFTSAVGDGVDGGLLITGSPTFNFSALQSMTGPFQAEGGIVKVTASAQLPASDGFFGHGDLVLRNEQLLVEKRAAAALLHLTDAEKSLHVEGGSMLTLRNDASGAAVFADLAKLGVGTDAALILDDLGVKVGVDGGSAVKVTGEAVATSAASGRVLDNVFGTTDGGNSVYFLAYDMERGFVPLSGVKSQSTFEGVSSGDVLEFAQNSDVWYKTPIGKAYAVEALLVKNQMTTVLNENTTVTIGDGVHPGVLALEKRTTLKGEKGSGVHFGTAPGLVVVGAYAAGADYCCTLSAPVLSANGLAIMGAPNNSSFHALMLSGANTYEGETRIGSVCVKAGDAKCFSTGDVRVLPGERHGGQVRFTKEDTWENNFYVAGNGIRHSEWNGRMGNGALSFAADATIAGNVELTARARFNTTASTVTGRVTGAVSGDKLWLYDSPGIVELDGANTYTGGTEIVQSKLALRRGDSAGTGPVVLDQGTLRFINAEPIVFTNDVTGSGTIEILGAPVRFTGKAFAALNGRVLAKGSVIEFPNIATDDLKYAAVLEGDSLDLGGEDTAFAEIWGAGTIAGGTVTVSGEIQPGGANAIGTLTFDRPPVFASGATFVCEDLYGACDKIVVEGGDVALDDLELAFTLIGTSRGKDAATIVAASDGAVSGEFASVTKTPQRAERAEVEYGASRVDMRLSQGVLLIVR